MPDLTYNLQEQEVHIRKPASEELRKKRSIRMMGNKYAVGNHKSKIFTEEHKKNLSNALKGKKLSEEHRRHISISHKGKKRLFPVSEEARERMSIARRRFYSNGGKPSRGMLGKTHSLEVKKKLSELKMGNKHWNWQGGITQNREWQEDCHKRWRKNNPLKVKLMNHKRRLFNSELSLITIQQVYEDNIKRFKTLTCYLCLKPIPFGKDHLEHKIPLSRGGNQDRNNLDIACQGCNCRKNNKTEEEFRRLYRG